MPLNNAATNGVAQEYQQFKGEELPKSHSYVDWLAKRNLTADSITAETSNASVITYSTESTHSGVWVGEVQMIGEGEANLILTLNAGGRVKKTVFKYVVRDARYA